MAIYALTGVVAIFNAVDLSDHVTSAEIKLSAADLDTTAFGSTFVGRIPGLKDSDLSVEFNADSAASSVDASLWAIYNGGAAVTCSVRALAAATSSTNTKSRVIAPSSNSSTGSPRVIAEAKIPMIPVYGFISCCPGP